MKRKARSAAALALVLGFSHGAAVAGNVDKAVPIIAGVDSHSYQVMSDIEVADIRGMRSFGALDTAFSSDFAASAAVLGLGSSRFAIGIGNSMAVAIAGSLTPNVSNAAADAITRARSGQSLGSARAASSGVILAVTMTRIHNSSFVNRR